MPFSKNQDNHKLGAKRAKSISPNSEVVITDVSTSEEGNEKPSQPISPPVLPHIDLPPDADYFEIYERYCGSKQPKLTAVAAQPAEVVEIANEVAVEVVKCQPKAHRGEKLDISFLKPDSEVPVELEDTNYCFNWIRQELGQIKSLLMTLPNRLQVQSWYSTEEFAQHVDKAEFTVREWCRLGRLKAEKRQDGRGANKAWSIAHAELERYRKEGLLADVRRN